MKVGDLVKFFSDESDHAGEIGLIVDEELPSVFDESDNRKLVQWGSGTRCSYPERQLEMINESR
jgi:hypothetical protein